MFSHVMVGTNNIEESKIFYDNLLNTIHIKGKYLAGAKINNWEIFDEQGVFQDFFK